MDEVLYKRGFSQPYLRCLVPNEANYVLREVHEEACENHSGARALVHKVVRASYYWPTIQANTKAYVKVCDQCQRFSNILKQPLENLTPMMALYAMGIRYLRPLSTWNQADEILNGRD